MVYNKKMNQADKTQSKFWLDIATADIAKRHPDGKIIVSSGISPSAHYHIGHFREILTAEAICWRLRQDGRTVEHVHVIDDFDPLRRRYDFLPPEYEKYVGWPLFKVPDPEGNCHVSYAEHFYANFEDYARQMGIAPTRVVRNSELYLSGQMTSAIEQVLEKIDSVRTILESISNRQLEADWTPLQVMTAGGQFEQGQLSSWDKSARTINEVDYTKGGVKMNWRLEWPVRWQVLGVMVEPFSHQEHGAAGGSYDTGARIAREVFGFEPPVPGAQYGNIHLKGDTKKMSSSKGNLYTPAQVLEVMPAEVLRYFVIKSRPEKQLDFDLHRGLYNLLEEYSVVEGQVDASPKPEFAEALLFSRDLGGAAVRTVSGVPFNHLVFAAQTARDNQDQLREILRRSGFGATVEKDWPVIERELDFVANWLDKYAPDNIKFELQKDCPVIELSKTQARFLDELATTLTKSDFTAQAIHDSVYAGAIEAQIKPAEAFALLYQLFLGQAVGPKIGYFLSNLEQNFVINRLKRQA